MILNLKPSKMHQILLLSSLFIFFSSPTLSQLSSPTDTLPQGQSLRDGRTLLSSAGIFELGFFTPGNSTSRYLGIWYHNITQSVVWVANRGTPLTNQAGTLTFASDGNLVLLTDHGIISWSTNTSSVSTNTLVSAQILDSGQLVLRSNGTKTVIWDSFDHPTDTFLPGMKISLNRRTRSRTLFRSWKSPNDPSVGKYSLGLDPMGSGQLFIWKGGRRPRWRSGQWDGTRFIGSTMRPLYLYGFKPTVDNSEGSMYFTFTQVNSSLLKFVLQWDGVENTSILVEESKDWQSVWVQPVNECETYGKCHGYGICSDGGSPICTCMKGFEPRFMEEWSKGNWSGGCVRRRSLQCEVNTSSSSIGSNGGDGFYKYEAVKVPDFANWEMTVLNEEDCRRSCAKNCSCNAYAYVRGIGCLIWVRDLVDIYQFSEGSGSDLYIKLAGSELVSGGKRKIWRTIVIICASVVFLLIICVLLLWKFNATIRGWLKRDEKQNNNLGSSLHSMREGNIDFSDPIEYAEGQEGNDAELPLLNFDIVASATSNFSDSNKLGEGGFGDVYKGTLPGGREVAVKRLSRSSGQGQEEFKNEMILIAKLQHRNLVRLLGCCIHEEEKMLIYEYLPNKSLDAFIFDPTRQPVLDWDTRFNIIEGIARGLVYLHRDSRLRIVHRDLKASNVLLDKDMNPKISDFGMARIFGSDQNQLNTNRVVGTFGYMSPEYAMEGLFSVKSDVYSFGILVLEIVSGRRNNSFHNRPNTINIVGHAWKLWNKDRAIEMIDQAILGSCSVPQVVRCIQVGLLCVQDRANDRPDMHSVVLMLGSENATLPLPKAPLFTMEESPSETQAAANTNESFSVNDVTITELLGR